LPWLGNSDSRNDQLGKEELLKPKVEDVYVSDKKVKGVTNPEVQIVLTNQEGNEEKVSVISDEEGNFRLPLTEGITVGEKFQVFSKKDNTCRKITEITIKIDLSESLNWINFMKIIA
jgi:hypothetical protein